MIGPKQLKNLNLSSLKVAVFVPTKWFMIGSNCSEMNLMKLSRILLLFLFLQVMIVKAENDLNLM